MTDTVLPRVSGLSTVSTSRNITERFHEGAMKNLGDVGADRCHPVQNRIRGRRLQCSKNDAHAKLRPRLPDLEFYHLARRRPATSLW